MFLSNRGLHRFSSWLIIAVLCGLSAGKTNAADACPTRSLTEIKASLAPNGKPPEKRLIDREKFWSELEKLTDKRETFTFLSRKNVRKEVQLRKNILDPESKAIVEDIFNRWESEGGGHPKHLALMLGTAYRETCGLMRSTVGEACGCATTCKKTEMNVRYGMKDQCGRAYFGRGFVQLTHRENYAKTGKLLAVPLEDYPDLAYERNIAIALLVDGVKNRWYAGKPLDSYLNDEKSDWVKARDSVSPGSPNKAATGYLGCRFYGAVQVAYAEGAPKYPVDECIRLKNE